jgi:DNA-binding transcriptional MerR regulator
MTAPRDRLYSITELARELGVTPRAIRFYESKGLVSPQRAGTTRIYSHRERARMLIILRGKRLGFTLAGIKEYLGLYHADSAHREQLAHLLRGTRRRIAELEQQRRDIEVTLDELLEVEQQTLDAMREQGIEPLDAHDGRERIRKERDATAQTTRRRKAR